MKAITRVLFLLCACCTINSFAQTVKHVILVIQENRTPDNLFAGDSKLSAAGANLVHSGSCHGKNIAFESWPLDACFDPEHQHANAWLPMWDNGKYDGACDIKVIGASCVKGQHPYLNYSYVANTPFDKQGNKILDPYYQVAENYGFANYMFQTNQGPSFPAHQFLFSGTSAPVSSSDSSECTDAQNNSYPCWQWFAAENPGSQTNGIAGCTAPPTANVPDIDPAGNIASSYNGGYPCYNHNTLTTLLEQNSLSWKYYAQPNAKSIWTAPNSISGICGAQNGQCAGIDWQQHVVLGNAGQYVGDYAPILTDIAKCNLPAVSWVIPDGTWSDHPGTGSSTLVNNGGPSWIAAIVNAVGNGQKCDGTGYWSDTVILITWDDWGGFFDHVSPAASAGGPGSEGYSNGTAQHYVYGPRVPLLVVSAYAKPKYISGPATNPDCSHGNTYCHDFGSILAYIEHVFNITAEGGIGTLSSPYADYLAPDGPVTCPACQSYPLADFFDTQFHPFTRIRGAKYRPNCFNKPKQNGCWPKFASQDPDNDEIDDD